MVLDARPCTTSHVGVGADEEARARGHRALDVLLGQQAAGERGARERGSRARRRRRATRRRRRVWRRQVGARGALEVVADGVRRSVIGSSPCAGRPGRDGRARGRRRAWCRARGDLVVARARRPRAGARPPGTSSSSRPSSQASCGETRGRRDLHAEPLAGARLERAPADRDQQHVAGDPEQPRAGRAVALVAEARADEPDLRERLGGQLVRGVLVAAAPLVVAEHALRVAVVELAERARVGPGRGEQGGVASFTRLRCRGGAAALQARSQRRTDRRRSDDAADDDQDHGVPPPSSSRSTSPVRPRAAEVEHRRGALVVRAGVLDPAHDLPVGVVLQRLEDDPVGSSGSGPSRTLKSSRAAGADRDVRRRRPSSAISPLPDPRAVQPGCGATFAGHARREEELERDRSPRRRARSARGT